MGINFQDVKFKYNRKSNINTIDISNLHISPSGEFITIVGQTGSGKSTLTQLMNGLLLPNEGTINVFDKVIKPKGNTNLKYVRKRIGLVFQFPEYQLFEETVLKDVMFGPVNFGKSKEEAEALAKETILNVGLSESHFTKSPFNLSGGQMRRVAIAGILASEPNVLILDEPTVGLDPKGKEEILSLLYKIYKELNKTIIIVTHDMDLVAKYSNRTIVLNHGVIVGDMTPIELFNNFDFLDKYHLDYPEASRLALGLKDKGLINFDICPITKEQLKNVILGKKMVLNGDNYE